MAFSNTAAKYSAILLYSSAIAFIVVLVVAAFNPGCTNVDTLAMWGQAHNRVYQDWHPVALTIVMTYLIPVYDGFQPVVVLQTLLFTLGVFLTIRKYSTPLLGVALLLGVAVFPPVFYWLGFVGKDSFMACLLIFATGALYRYADNGSRVFFWLGIAGLLRRLRGAAQRRFCRGTVAGMAPATPSLAPLRLDYYGHRFEFYRIKPTYPCSIQRTT